KACGPFDFPYDRRRFMPPVLSKPQPLPDGMEEHRSTTIILAVAISLCVIALPMGLVHMAFFVIGCVGGTVLGSWLGIHLWFSPWQREYRRRRDVRNHALRELEVFEDGWEQTVSRYSIAHFKSCDLVQKLITQCRELSSQYQTELQRMTANAEAVAR